MFRNRFSLAVIPFLFAISGCIVEEEETSDASLDLNEVQQELSGPVTIKSADLNVLQYGCFSNSRLRWQSDGTCYGPYFYGSNLSAQYKSSYNGGNTTVNDPWNGYPGECVSLVKSLASSAVPSTSSWIKGAKVMNGGISIGTAVATFNGAGGGYGGHTGFFAGYSGSCFWIFDQNWVSAKTVGKHQFCVTGSGNLSDANSYYVVNVP